MLFVEQVVQQFSNGSLVRHEHVEVEEAMMVESMSLYSYEVSPLFKI